MKGSKLSHCSSFINNDWKWPSYIVAVGKRWQKKMRFPNKKVARAVLLLAIFSLIMTAFTLSLLKNGHRSSDCVRKFVVVQSQNKSSDNFNETLPYFISSAEDLLSNIRTAVSDDLADVNAVSHSITIVIEQMKSLLSQAEHQLQENEIKLFLSRPVVNNHSFSYHHNRIEACSKQNIDVIFVVPSAPANSEKRQAVRHGNRGDYVRNSTNNATLLFFLGRPRTQNYTLLQENIDEEVNEFGDIIQEDFEDIYSNNRLKSVSMLRWISTYCTNAKYVIRSDDDVNITVSAVLDTLDRTAKTLSNFIIGRKRVDDKPARNVGNKYYLSLEEYPQATFPPYLLGGLLGYPVSTAKLLYQAALRVKPIWLEDVYITGICASKLYIPVLADPAVVYQHRSSGK